MSTLDETTFVERLQFFNGQRLFASDLQALEASNREMRWLHNQSLHQPGVGSGFSVTGKRGDREVRVGPGYALDASGREIVLTREWVEPVPPVAGDGNGGSVFFDLAVSYPEDRLLEESETREGICLPRGVVRLREEPVLCWIQLSRDLSPVDSTLRQKVQEGQWIVLARAEVLQCRLRQDVSFAVRRSARPAQRPYVACGIASPDKEWHLEAIKNPAGSPWLYRFSERIKTSSGSFLTTPTYSVRLDGTRIRYKAEDKKTLEQVIFDTYPSILDPQPDGFTVELLLWASAPNPGQKVPWKFDTPDLTGWKVVWMGVE